MSVCVLAIICLDCIRLQGLGKPAEIAFRYLVACSACTKSSKGYTANGASSMSGAALPGPALRDAKWQ